jgi:NADH-quinone oxidoreductase subunit B
MLMHAILTLHDHIAATPLGVDRAKAAREAEAAALNAPTTLELKGLLR